MEGKWILCRNCIDAIKSRGEKIYVGDIVNGYDFKDEPTKCEWCNEEDVELYECIQWGEEHGNMQR